MSRLFLVGIGLSLFLMGPNRLACGMEKPDAKDGPSAKDQPATNVEDLVQRVKKSIVVVTVARQGNQREALGTGFVVHADGLLATNLHVLGEARPIAVQFADGKRFDVTEVVASDRRLDLAIVRINAKQLPTLPLGDSEAIREGQDIVVVGNPLGLRHSVVRGVISGRRDFDGRSMIQLAIPIEVGNSGSPVVDLAGRVFGIVTMKSLVTQNLGFAMPVNDLKTMLARPNPIPMSRWLTMNTLDPAEWTPLFGTVWQRKIGRIFAGGLGDGFGGRTLLLRKTLAPKDEFDLTVTVKLDDESGAAGLVFNSDGADRHFGFYPSGGKLRLTRFDGPDVFSWKILHDEPSSAYRPGEWNKLTARIDSQRVRCFVNDAFVVETARESAEPILGAGFHAGQFGLAKFRQTTAEFRDFGAKSIQALSEKARERLNQGWENLPDRKDLAEKDLDAFLANASGRLDLRQQANELERRAANYRKVAQALYQRSVCLELAKLVAQPEDKIDLFRAALLIARLDDEELRDVDYLAEIDFMANEIRKGLAPKASELDRLAALDRYLFAEHGFHGNRNDYYNRSNSYVSDVIEYRVGLPITLSIVYMELARRLEVPIVGVGLPGHFVVRYEPKMGSGKLIDPFEGGKALTPADAEKRVEEMTGEPIRPEHLKPMTKKAILVRVLGNLIGVAKRSNDIEAMLRYLDATLAIDPELGPERWIRAVANFQTQRLAQAKADCDWLLEKQPKGVPLEDVHELSRLVVRQQVSRPASGSGKQPGGNR